MRIIALIPARLESSRLPEKVLADLGGKSLIYRVYKQAVNAEIFDQVVVATDHEKIVQHCQAINIPVVLTSQDHQSGTDRIAEAATHLDAEIIVNIQGDEPFIEKESILALVSLIKKDFVHIATLCKPMPDTEALLDYNVVKLVKNRKDEVMYFSRQAIPAQRDKPYKLWLESSNYLQHLGLYAFKRETLLELVKLELGILEQSEKLEQLRWMENGYKVHCVEVKSESFGIDTKDDLERARGFYK